MHPHHLFPSSFLFFMLVTLSYNPTSLGQHEQYTNCSQVTECANIQSIGYPFWGGTRPEYCGHPSFELNCTGDAPQITIESRPYRVLAIDNTTLTLHVVREEFWGNSCPTLLYNATLDTAHFEYSTSTQDLTLYYGCQTISTISLPNQFNCSTNGSDTVSIYTTRSVGSISTSDVAECNTSVIVPVNQSAALALENTSTMNITEALDVGFTLQWEANNSDCDACVNSGGLCGWSNTSFVCYCSDQSYALTCNNSSPNQTGGSGSGSSSSSQIQIILPIVGAILAGIGLGWIIFACRQRRKKRITTASAQSAQSESKDNPSPPLSKDITYTTTTTKFSQNIPSYPSSNTEFGKASTYFGVQVFSYDELEEATDNFNSSRELGEGGFGTVYYGNLRDGRVVAVKRLFENNFKRVEQFMNEVEILTRLRHDNLVTLYGCTSKRSRELLLVYEYIPNGTVADHLHGKRSNSGLLSWPVRLSIAIETAEAIAYLHASTIIHRDVKTNNILLDNDFRVKVADFGLSRLFPNDVTHVSTAPQGTPGYVDPEYYQCYQVTEKSDVYSFGVVLIELISSKQAVDTNRSRQEINLANMAINKIQNHTLHELVDPSLGFETNRLVRRMTTLVAELAFRCLQMDSVMRPSMGEVVEALRGIKNEEVKTAQEVEEEAEVVDIVIGDDVGLLKGNLLLPPMSPDSAVTEKWVSNSTTPNSSA